MIDTLVPRTLFALSLVVLPATAAAQSSPSESDQLQSAEDSPEETSDEESEESESSDSSGDEDGDPSASGGEQAGEQSGDQTTPDEQSSDQQPDEQPASGEQTDEEKQAGEKQTEENEQAEESAQTDEDEQADEATSRDKDQQAGPETPSTSPPKVEGMQSQSEQAKDKKEKEDRAEEASSEGQKSPISDLAESSDGDKDEAFEPVADIDEESLEQLTPAKVYPYLEWEGVFRVRTDADVNFDLDTDGTSAILPPAENDLPSGAPAKSDADVLWGTDADLRLEPTIHISEGLRIHIESAIFDNVVFGSLSDRRLTQPGVTLSGADRSLLRPDPTRTVYDSNQLPPREREWFEDALQINELWGEVDMFLGELRAGRMDNHWGLGMHSNGGDCLDCDYGDHVDRIRFLTKPLGFYTSASIDFPDQGVTSQSPVRIDGQPYDLAQIDDARQYTFSIFKKPRSDKDRKLQQKKLKEDEVPVVNGGARFTLRSQKGVFVPSGNQNPRDGRLVYRGLNLYVPDVWAQFLYEPQPDTRIRVALETVGVFGDIDNTTNEQVGPSDEGRETVNCFNEGKRNAHPEQCTSTSSVDDTTAGITQFGTALESEFYFGGPVRFGLNSGLASGGNAPNWGYQSTGSGSLDFYRFDPNYHVDLILFREVIGTVTNAYYFNPYAQARFFESPDQRMEVQLDTILSRATKIEGTPAGREGNRWLGLEVDGAVRYLQIGRFQAGVEGGILFPFGALDAKLDRARLTQPFSGASQRFTQPADASIAWTVQGNLNWKF